MISPSSFFMSRMESLSVYESDVSCSLSASPVLLTITCGMALGSPRTQICSNPSARSGETWSLLTARKRKALSAVSGGRSTSSTTGFPSWSSPVTLISIAVPPLSSSHRSSGRHRGPHTNYSLLDLEYTLP